MKKSSDLSDDVQGFLVPAGPAALLRSNRSNLRDVSDDCLGNAARQHLTNPDTGKRLSRLNPPEDWKIEEVQQLRILDDQLWHAVKTRQGRW